MKKKRKMTKGTRNMMLKCKTKFENYKNCLKMKQLGNKSRFLEANNFDIEDSKQKHEHF